MKKYKWIIVLLNLAILLVYFNVSINKKENILKNGKLILLQLAPIDPRSLMQGDYMELRYQIAQKTDEKMGKRGYCVVLPDSNNVAKFVRCQPGRQPLNAGETLVEYTYTHWRLNIGAESYFFQEGQAKRYDSVAYGGIRVDDKGNSVLIGLYDKHFRKL